MNFNEIITLVLSRETKNVDFYEVLSSLHHFTSTIIKIIFDVNVFPPNYLFTALPLLQIQFMRLQEKFNSPCLMKFIRTKNP